MTNDASAPPRSDAAASHEEFDAFYANVAAPLRRFFQRAGCSADESRDLAQDTLLRAYNGLDSFRREASDKTWVLRIAARVLSNHHRWHTAAKRGAYVVPLDEAAEHAAGNAPGVPWVRDEGGPQGALLGREARELVGAALNELPPQMRRCMLLYLTQELKYREIAVILHISIGAVKSQIHEARRRLRTRLQPYFLPGDH